MNYLLLLKIVESLCFCSLQRLSLLLQFLALQRALYFIDKLHYILVKFAIGKILLMTCRQDVLQIVFIVTSANITIHISSASRFGNLNLVLRYLLYVCSILVKMSGQVLN